MPSKGWQASRTYAHLQSRLCSKQARTGLNAVQPLSGRAVLESTKPCQHRSDLDNSKIPWFWTRECGIPRASSDHARTACISVSQPLYLALPCSLSLSLSFRFVVQTLCCKKARSQKNFRCFRKQFGSSEATNPGAAKGCGNVGYLLEHAEQRNLEALPRPCMQQVVLQQLLSMLNALKPNIIPSPGKRMTPTVPYASTSVTATSSE